MAGPADLWKALETAVRTPADPLPVDRLLPPPEEQAARYLARRDPPAPPEPDPAEDPAAETGLLEIPEHPPARPADVEAELRARLGSTGLAELDDV